MIHVKTPKPNKETLGLEYATLTQEELATKYGVCRTVIRRWLKSYGIKQDRTSSECLDKIAKGNKRAWKTEEYKINQSEAYKSSCRDPKHRANLSKALQEKYKDPEYKTKMSKTTSSLEYKDNISKVSKKAWQDPEYRAKQYTTRASSVYRDRLSASLKNVCASPEYRAKMAIARENMPRSLTRPHLKVCELLTSLGVQFTTEEAIGPWTFDIFIESDNILIEVQGDYWHSLPKHERNDRAKSTYIMQHPKQYKLYYIWEHECLTEGSVLAKLRHWLGLDKVEQVDYEFSQVVLKPVEGVKQADTFLYNWHYQHHGRHGLDLGGYLGDELICLARFTSPSRAEIAISLNYAQKQVLELARLVVHPKYQKKNLCSWLLARCERYIRQKRPEIECLVSFADSTHNHTGVVYKAANWELNRVVEPNYWYIDQDGWVMHKKTLWNHANSLRMSEAEYAEKNGYIKVWGKEKYKFIKKLK